MEFPSVNRVSYKCQYISDNLLNGSYCYIRIVESLKAGHSEHVPEELDDLGLLLQAMENQFLKVIKLLVEASAMKPLEIDASEEGK